MAKKDESVKVRVLLDCAFGKANAVVVLTAAELAAAGNQVDAHPDSVAYAESLATPAQ